MWESEMWEYITSDWFMTIVFIVMFLVSIGLGSLIWNILSGIRDIVTSLAETRETTDQEEIEEFIEAIILSRVKRELEDRDARISELEDELSEIKELLK